MTDLARRFDDPFGDVMQRLWERATGAAWPVAVAASAQQAATGRFPVNIYEDGANYYMTCMLPGVRPDALEVSTEGNVLTISGAYQPHAPEGAAAVLQEFGPVQFRRQFSLGSGLDTDGISAHYENGMLQLVLSKAQQNRTRRIPIAGVAAPEPVADVVASHLN